MPDYCWCTLLQTCHKVCLQLLLPAQHQLAQCEPVLGLHWSELAVCHPVVQVAEDGVVVVEARQEEAEMASDSIAIS